MSNSFSQESIASSDGNNEDALFKNKLLMQTLQASTQPKIEEKMNNGDESAKKLRDELAQAIEKRNHLDEKLNKVQNDYDKLAVAQKENGFFLRF